MNPENEAEIIQDGIRTRGVSRGRFLLTLLALGASACFKKVEQATIIITATPTTLPPEQPIVTPTPEPATATVTTRPVEPTNTPEVIKSPVGLIERLTVYSVYHGNLLDETNKPIGEVLVTRFPDHEKRGKQIWLNTQITKPCSNGSKLAPSGTLSERDIRGNELVSDFRPRRIQIRITNQPTTISGDYFFRAVGACPDQDINSHFELFEVATGFEALVRYSITMNQRLGVTATRDYTLKSLDAAYGGSLAEVPPAK